MVKSSIVLCFFSLFLVASCGENKVDKPIVHEAGAGITTVSGDFGQVGPTSSKIITFSIKNTGDSPLMGPPSIDNANFNIIYQNGCASVLPTKSCIVKVSFDAKGKTPGLYESNLNLDSFFLELSATIPAPVVPAPEVAQAQYQLSTSGSAITEIDFGNLTSNQNVIKTFYLKNISQSPINQVVSFPSNYIVSYDMCSNRAIAKGATCMIKVSLSASGKSGTQDASVSYAGINLLLKGNVQATQLPPAVTPAPDVDFILSNQVVSDVDFGELSPTGSKLVTISLKNTGNINLNESVILTGEYELLYDTCSLKPIAVNGTCLLKVNLSGTGKSGAVVGNVAYAGQNLSLTGFVATPASPSPTLFPEIVFMNGTSEVSTVDMGFFPYGSSQQLIINIKNKGTLSDVAKTASLNNSNFSIGYNQCSNKALAINESCQVRIIFAANGKPEGTYNSILSFGDVSLNLTAFAGNAIITYSPVYSDYGNCSVTETCQGTGLKTRSITACQKLANGEPIEGGTLADCASFAIPANLEQSCLSPAGQKIVEVDNGDKTVSCLEGGTEQAFVSLSCDNNYFVNGQVCSPDVITYEPVYSSFGICSSNTVCSGSGSQNRTLTDCRKIKNGVDESSTDLINCSIYSTTENLQQTCLSPSGEKTVAISNGSYQVFCEIGETSETYVSNSLACDNGYLENEQLLICELDEPTILSKPFEIAYASPDVPPTFVDNSSSVPLPTYITAQQSYSAPTHSLAVPNTSQVIPAGYVEGDSSSDALPSQPIDNMADSSTGMYVYSQDSVQISTDYSSIINNVTQGIYFNQQYNVEIPFQKYTIRQVTNINSAGSDTIRETISFNNQLYFAGGSYNKLYKVNSDGTISVMSKTSGSNTVNDEVGNFIQFNGQLYFTANNNAGFRKLFKITSAGVVSQVSNTRNGAADIDTSGVGKFMIVFNNHLYFKAFNTSGFSKLFRVNTAGTVIQVTNLYSSGNDSISNKSFHVVKDTNENDLELYFISKNSSNGSKLFKLNTSNVVSQVTNLTLSNQNDFDGSSTYFPSINQTLFYRNYNNAGVWRPQPNGHFQIFKLFATNIWAFNGFIYAGTGTKMYKINPTTTVATKLSRTNTGTNSDNVTFQFELNNELYFTADKTTNGNRKLYKINTNDVITQISDTNPGGNDNPSNFFVHDGEVYFNAYSSANANFKTFKMSSDGRVSLFLDLYKTGASQSAFFTNVNGQLHFRTVNAQNRTKIFKLIKE